MERQTLQNCLKARGSEQMQLFRLSREMTDKQFGKKIHFRGIVEFCNICENDCSYCGIRKGNDDVDRFKMSMQEIEQCVDFVAKAKYGSIVFQSGELTSDVWKEYLLDIIRMTHEKYPCMGITVSCGEQDYDFYKKMKEAGASRFLLRIETSNSDFYKKLHPKKMSWGDRCRCLQWLQELDYQVGTGVMVGLPGQTLDDLCSDLKFFKENDFDMFGIGPYVVHAGTPLSTDEVQEKWNDQKDDIYNLTLNFLALLRIILPDVNIAAATALDVFDPLGRIKVLKNGANVIMPSVTPKDYRENYLLYQNKPCVDEDADKCYGCMTSKITLAGLEPVFGEQGTSPHYTKKIWQKGIRNI